MGHEPINLNQRGGKCMLVSSFCASRPRDATRRMSVTELVLRSSVAAAAPSQQQLRRSSSSVAAVLQPSTQMVVSSSRPSSRCCLQHLEEGHGGTSRRDASCCCRAASAPSQKHQLRRSSISSVTAARAGDRSVPGARTMLNGRRGLFFFEASLAKASLDASLALSLLLSRLICI